MYIFFKYSISSALQTSGTNTLIHVCMLEGHSTPNVICYIVIQYFICVNTIHKHKDPRAVDTNNCLGSLYHVVQLQEIIWNTLWHNDILYNIELDGEPCSCGMYCVHYINYISMIQKKKMKIHKRGQYGNHIELSANSYIDYNIVLYFFCILRLNTIYLFIFEVHYQYFSFVNMFQNV